MDENNTTTDNKESNSESTHKTTSGNSSSKKAIGVLMVFGLVALGVWLFINQQGTSEEAQEIDFGDVGMVQSPEDVDFSPTKEYPAVVAKVNGEDLTREEFETAYVQLAQSAWQQGVDITDMVTISEIEVRALDVLISTKLLTQAAIAGGNSVDDATVDEELALIESQFASPEEFAQTIEDSGLTLDEVRGEVHDRLLIDEYFTNTEGIENVVVTEAEVQEVYDSYFGADEEAPALAEVYDSIEGQLMAGKQQEVIEGVISELEADATIEKMI